MCLAQRLPSVLVQNLCMLHNNASLLIKMIENMLYYCLPLRKADAGNLVVCILSSTCQKQVEQY